MELTGIDGAPIGGVRVLPSLSYPCAWWAETRPELVWGIPPEARDGFKIVDTGLCPMGVSLGGHRLLMKL